MENSMAYILPNEREVISEVLLKLEEKALPDLPLACKTCPAAMWQITGRDTAKVTARCYCRTMHTFTWDSKNQEEILDCDMLYATEEQEEGLEDEEDRSDDLPPFLRGLREKPQGEIERLQDED
ncbi:TPA: hypothetical protein QCL04_005938 [Pseudomonas aeruginosa]|uniref:hypothetical protein n=2 Tax=Pseudomonas TaxID=286 RepID=UPI000F53DF05|nr:hypothetical protein [Pseudomonas aeruginosa]RPT78052.1 hypothetical protein IPC940_29630 [Pseudomonas aeruginosa]RTA96151.1 hypothetical protein EJ607_03705 [Pseudomonas aeruginosa]UJF43114.1 hypothetical protein JKV45_32800 [Pseudomonas aeruginosa]HDR3051873.1 hypothetical protein [Pseudomonas aeruginosa]HDR3109432.1 hypothetical protein [Pseudomonas aeruginosa]